MFQLDEKGNDTICHWRTGRSPSDQPGSEGCFSSWTRQNHKLQMAPSQNVKSRKKMTSRMISEHLLSSGNSCWRTGGLFSSVCPVINPLSRHLSVAMATVYNIHRWKPCQFLTSIVSAIWPRPRPGSLCSDWSAVIVATPPRSHPDRCKKFWKRRNSINADQNCMFYSRDWQTFNRCSEL